jgi:hypothetical protein
LRNYHERARDVEKTRQEGLIPGSECKHTRMEADR